MTRAWGIWSKTSKEEHQGYLALVASACAFSLMTVCVKHLNGRMPVAEIVLARSLISLLITIIMLNRLNICPWGECKTLLLIRGLTGTAALFCVFKALDLLPLASATVIQYTYPTFTSIAAFLLLGEKLRKRIGIALILGWLGVTFVANPDLINKTLNGLDNTAILIALTGALLTSLAYICVRKLSKSEHPLVIVFYFPLVSVPITLPLVLNNAVLPVGFDWLWLLGIGLFTQLGQVCITEGLRILPAARASSINYVQVLFAALWGLIIFEEKIGPIETLGAICILFATLLSLTTEKRNID